MSAVFAARKPGRGICQALSPEPVVVVYAEPRRFAHTDPNGPVNETTGQGFRSLNWRHYLALATDGTVASTDPDLLVFQP